MGLRADYLGDGAMHQADVDVDFNMCEFMGKGN